MTCAILTRVRLGSAIVDAPSEPVDRWLGADRRSGLPFPARLRYTGGSFPPDRPILGGRSTVGHVALDHVIGVRIPASQPILISHDKRLRCRRLRVFRTAASTSR